MDTVAITIAAALAALLVALDLMWRRALAEMLVIDQRRPSISSGAAGDSRRRRH